MKRYQQTLMFPDLLHQWYSAIQLEDNSQPSSPSNSTCILYLPDTGIQTWSFSPSVAAKAVQDKVNYVTYKLKNVGRRACSNNAPIQPVYFLQPDNFAA